MKIMMMRKRIHVEVCDDDGVNYDDDDEDIINVSFL
jgi:hypothetical protein